MGKFYIPPLHSYQLLLCWILTVLLERLVFVVHLGFNTLNIPGYLNWSHSVAHRTELYKVPQRRRASCCSEQKEQKIRGTTGQHFYCTHRVLSPYLPAVTVESLTRTPTCCIICCVMTAVKNLTVYQFKCSCKTLNQKICILKIVEKNNKQTNRGRDFLAQMFRMSFHVTVAEPLTSST